MMRLAIDSRLQEIERATALVEAFSARHGLAPTDTYALCVVLDELISNAIRHGLGGAAGHEIQIALDHAGDAVSVEIEHGGVAFDPTLAPAPVLATTLAERKPGGVGIAFVRNLTDSFEYQRVGERNRIRLRRRLTH
jgi:anti-sigma regulatory factor (Ser/Thr protein kinase)